MCQPFLYNFKVHSVVGSEMKKTIILIGALLFVTANAGAGDLFGGGWKPKPNFTLFGQKISWKLPSLCLGAKAGVMPDAGISPDGLSFKIPYLALDLPFPSLTLSAGKEKAKVELKLGSIEKTEHKTEKD